MSAASSWDDVVASRDMRLVAKHYRDCGLAPIPLHRRSKRPIHDDWPNLVADDLTPFPGNIGVKCGEPSSGLVDLDLDCREAMLLAPAVMPPTVACFGRPSAPCSHWLYTCDPTPEATRQWINDSKEMILEVRSTGGQTMFPPSIHPDGEIVSWHQQGQAALVEGAQLHRSAGILAACALLMQHWPKPEVRTRYHAYGAMIGSLLRRGVDVETVERVVEVFVEQFSPGRATRSRLRAARALRARLDTSTGRVPGFKHSGGVFGEVVAKLCRERLPRSEEEAGYPLSEQGLALEFVAEQKQWLSFTPAWDRWHLWDGAVWRRDDRLFAFSAASHLCRRVAKTLTKADEAKRLGAAHTRAAVVNLAREHLVVTVDQWNTDPMLLGTPGGIWDLRTGGARPGCRDYINRAVRADPVFPDYSCPLWLGALGATFQNDEELIAYVQRLAGYCLTGSVREEVLSFLHGEGGNGKGPSSKRCSTAWGTTASRSQ